MRVKLQVSYLRCLYELERRIRAAITGNWHQAEIADASVDR